MSHVSKVVLFLAWPGKAEQTSCMCWTKDAFSMEGHCIFGLNDSKGLYCCTDQMQSFGFMAYLHSVAGVQIDVKEWV